MEIRSKIPQQAHGENLVDYLERRFTYLKREQWIERVAEGRFSVNGEVLRCDSALVKKTELIYDMPPLKEPPADLNYEIVDEQDDFFIVNKPGNLLVHKSGPSITHNLIYQLRHVHKPPFKEAHIVNRLDRETSGLVVVAKNKKALIYLNSLFAERKVSKGYCAVVKGVPEHSKGKIDCPIVKDSDSAIRYKHRCGVYGEGKEAYTEYEVLKTGEKNSLISFKPHTGRVHQLRLHACALGTPIVGDKLYGMREEDYLKWRKNAASIDDLEAPRQMLHCLSLSFTYSGITFDFAGEIPKDMQAYVDAL